MRISLTVANCCSSARTIPMWRLTFAGRTSLTRSTVSKCSNRHCPQCPHGKIHAYGTDMGGRVDWAWAHASIARDNIAIALAEMVEMEYLGLEEAKEVAYAWLFGNANEFFRLGLKS